MPDFAISALCQSHAMRTMWVKFVFHRHAGASACVCKQLRVGVWHKPVILCGPNEHRRMHAIDVQFARKCASPIFGDRSAAKEIFDRAGKRTGRITFDERDQGICQDDQVGARRILSDRKSVV